MFFRFSRASKDRYQIYKLIANVGSHRGEVGSGILDKSEEKTKRLILKKDINKVNDNVLTKYDILRRP